LGIPWNNNNAEDSIKPFAKWRKKISRSLMKKNIEQHLVLLSILQTCKYQSINFFEFLKSGEKAFMNIQKSNRLNYYGNIILSSIFLSQIFTKFATILKI